MLFLCCILLQNRLILYLIKSHNSLLSITSLNSSNHKGTLSFISATKSSSFTRLALNFQKEGPYVFWFAYAVKMEKNCQMVRIYRSNDIGLLNVVLAYIANKSSLNKRISLTPPKAFRVRISYAPNVNQIKIQT